MVSILYIHQINALSRQDFINNLVSLLPPGSAKSLQSPQFSDVIVLAGNDGYPVAFHTLPRHTTGGKKGDQPKPAKLQG